MSSFILFDALTNLNQPQIIQTYILPHYKKTIQITQSNDEEPSMVSFHFSLESGPLNIQEDYFTFEKKELIQDVYFQCPPGGLTLELNVWPKERLLHEYDGKNGKEIINTFESVMVKRVENALESKTVEISKKHFSEMIIERFLDELVVFDLDMVQTMRYVYSYNEDPSIKLFLASTLIRENKFYNHGTITSNTSNENSILKVLQIFGREKMSFPLLSPTIEILKERGTLPENVSDLMENGSAKNHPFNEKGFYFDDEEEEEFEELTEQKKQAILLKLENLKQQLNNIRNLHYQTPKV